MKWEIFFGILAVLLGIYQMVNSYKYVKVIQHHGNKTTSSFSAMAVWYSLLFGIGMLVLGCYAIFIGF